MCMAQVGGWASLHCTAHSHCMSEQKNLVGGGWSLSSDLNLRISTFETHPLGKSQIIQGPPGAARISATRRVDRHHFDMGSVLLP
jgi:hypothetical protein